MLSSVTDDYLLAVRKLLFSLWHNFATHKLSLAVDTAGDDDLPASRDDNNASFSTRPHYYDSMDDDAQLSVPSVASSFLKTQPSSSNTAMYNLSLIHI